MKAAITDLHSTTNSDRLFHMSRILGKICAASALAIVSAAIVAVPTVAAEGAVGTVYIDPRPSMTEELEEYIFEQEAAYRAAIETERERLAADTGKAETETIDNLAVEASAVLDEAQSHYVFDLFSSLELKSVAMPMAADGTDIERILDERRAVIDEKLETATTPLTEAVNAWAAEVAAENERIRIAEEEAAAKKAAAEAARSGARTQAGPPAVAIPGESTEARIARLMGRLGVSVAYGIGNCDGIANALGCYRPGGSQIYFTQRGLRDDCTIMRVITHEMRHMWQWNNGLIDLAPNGVSRNAAWLEQDAHAHTYCF